MLKLILLLSRWRETQNHRLRHLSRGTYCCFSQRAGISALHGNLGKQASMIDNTSKEVGWIPHDGLASTNSTFFGTTG